MNRTAFHQHKAVLQFVKKEYSAWCAAGRRKERAALLAQNGSLGEKWRECQKSEFLFDFLFRIRPQSKVKKQAAPCKFLSLFRRQGAPDAPILNIAAPLQDFLFNRFHARKQKKNQNHAEDKRFRVGIFNQQEIM